MSLSTNKLGRYELRREIARSNDVVYEAWDPTVNRRVAIKELVMPPGLAGAAAEDRIRRFYREARAAGSLSHPNIVTIYEVGEDAGRHFIAMEYLDGPTLRQTLQGGNRLPVETAVEIAAQVADALAFAHRHGVIHRDIKPDNVHLMPDNTPKLTDFGIARIASETNITLAGQVFGTPSYMSPEQVAGGELDTRTDVFSLGVMLFEMVAGRKPFTGDSVVTITYNIVHESPAMPAEAPEWLVGILRKALRKRSEERYATAEEMARDLRARRGPNGSWGSGAPSRTVPVPTFAATDPAANATLPSAPATWRLRTPRIGEEARTFLAALGVTLLFAALLWWGIWVSGKAFHQQRRAEEARATATDREEAVLAYKQGHFAEAVHLFSVIYQRTGADADRWMLSRSYVEYGWQIGGAGAVRQFEYAARAAPDAVQPLVSLATWYYQAHQTGPALRYADQALALVVQGAPDAPDMRPALAELYLYLGDYAAQIGAVGGLGATDLWKKSVLADPTLSSEAAAAAAMRLRGAS